MADYSCLSHQELYDRVQAGDKDALAKVADELHALRSEVSALADDLRKSLGGLAEVWRGAASAEYQRRVGTIPTFATGIGDDLTQTWAAVGVLGDEVGEAKRTIPPPQDTDDHGQLLLGGLVGILGGAAGTAGGIVAGYIADEHQKNEAKAEAVRIANALGNVAEASRDRFTQPLTPPPAGIPVSTGPGPAAAPGGTAVAAGAAAARESSGAPAGHAGAGHAGAAKAAGHAGGHGEAPGARLAAAEPLGVLGGAAGEGPAPAASAPPGAGGASSTGVGALGGFGAAGAGAIGGVGAIGGAGAIGGTGRGSAAGLATGGGLFDKSAARGPAAVIGSGSGTGPVAPIGRSGGGGGTHEPGPHDTWLTEDDMVWADESDPPSGVLGAPCRGNTPGR